MNNDEQVFDYLAAAEDTGKQLDELIKAIPGEVRDALAIEYRKSPWLATLPTTADKVTAAAERAESAAAILIKKATLAGLIVCLAAIILPLLTWGYAYWQTSKLRNEQAAIQAETAFLQELATALKDETGGGVILDKDGNGKWYVALPLGVEVDQQGYYRNGRFGFVYTWPPVRQ